MAGGWPSRSGVPSWGAKYSSGLCLLLAILLLASSADAQKKNKNKNKNGGGGGGNTTTEYTEEEETVTGPILTGNPQLDYIHDPNLPHELNGYDMSDYPFYKRVPKEGHNFTCDNRLDGFYASVPHLCQVYYNCLFGTRYDFLCANYTVFDQVNFICHYASEVDCANSERYYDRNEELYVTTTTTTPAPVIIYVDRPRPRPIRPLNNRRPTPPRRRNRPRPAPARPVETAPEAQGAKTTKDAEYYDYYDNNDYYYDDYYYDDAQLQATTTTTTTTTVRPIRRRQQQRPGAGGGRRRGGGQAGGGEGGGRRRRLRPRGGAGGGGQGGRRRRVKTTTTTTAAPAELEEYLDDYYYYDDATYDDAAAEKQKPAAAAPKEKEEDNPRSRPGQIRRPNFRRPQSLASRPIDPPAPVIEETVSSTIEKPELNAQVDEVAEEPQVGSNRRQSSARRPIPSSQRVVSRKVESSRSTSVDKQPEAPEPATINTQNDIPVSRGQARGSQRRIQPFVRPTQSELAVEGEAPAAAEEEAADTRAPGSGFGGRRSRS